ncbi:MAG: hypothetical protein HC772_06120 [Leptolyngbyaceae cyanobacterium CRU_2_3]|nr:hypothetical protein [Leptolyngbyaceae cyanobacterium CRU_2_3]
MHNRLQQDLLKWDRTVATHPEDAKIYVQRGMARFKLAMIPESIQDFDRSEQLDANITPYLWQRGLSYYYANRFEEGANQFEIDLTVNARDVEETVWRYLCIAQLAGASTARQSLLEVNNDSRHFMQQIYGLFAGHITPEQMLRTLPQESNPGKFYSRLYVGLYYEAAGNIDQAKTYIDQAVQTFGTEYRADDYMGYVAIVHRQVRQWI